VASQATNSAATTAAHVSAAMTSETLRNPGPQSKTARGERKAFVDMELLERGRGSVLC
jgi:hypothetical protein